MASGPPSNRVPLYMKRSKSTYFTSRMAQAASAPLASTRAATSINDRKTFLTNGTSGFPNCCRSRRQGSDIQQAVPFRFAVGLSYHSRGLTGSEKAFDKLKVLGFSLQVRVTEDFSVSHGTQNCAIRDYLKRPAAGKDKNCANGC